MEVDTTEEHQPASPQNEQKQYQQIPEQLMNGDEGLNLLVLNLLLIIRSIQTRGKACTQN